MKETTKFNNMIEAFECDFKLAIDKENHSLEDLQKQINSKDERLLKDIDLLCELSWGLRNGKLVICEVKE